MEDYTTLTTAFAALRKHHLTLQKLSALIAATPSSSAPASRISDVSDSYLFSNPVQVGMDLAHYKDLFSQLRFSYLEQVTKEKCLRAITEEPPLVIEASDNDALAKQLAVSKAELKKSKLEVESLLSEIEAIGRRLSSEHETITTMHTHLTTLPQKISDLTATIAALQHLQPSSEPDLNLPLPETHSLLSSQELELSRLEREFEEEQARLPGLNRRLEALGKEIRPMEMDKEGMEKFACEAVRMRDNARAEGRLESENVGRWYKSAYEALSTLTNDEPGRHKNIGR
ncbi:hypothetical protein RUND412_008083 [Rhizina undulata]